GSESGTLDGDRGTGKRGAAAVCHAAAEGTTPLSRERRRECQDEAHDHPNDRSHHRTSLWIGLGPEHWAVWGLATANVRPTRWGVNRKQQPGCVSKPRNSRHRCSSPG